MKSDLDLIKGMLESKGFPYELEKFGDQTVLIVERGYVGFATQFTFDLDGTFEDIGAYE